MTLKPPTRAMRENPDLNQLKRQAKELLDAYRASLPDVLAEVSACHRTATPETFALHDAQFVLARSYGFESWPKLKAAVDGVTAAQLHRAVETGEIETARNLLTRRPEIVDLGYRGEMRAVHMAVMRRDLEMTKLLVEFGADPDEGIWPNRDATGPFVMARERGYDEIAGVLDAARRDRGTRGPAWPTEGLRKLSHAYRTENEAAVLAVLNEHPDLAELRSPDGLTMLHRAAGRGWRLMAAWLIERGADISAKTPEGWTPLDYAARGGGKWLFDNAEFERMAPFLIEHGAALSPLSAAAMGHWDYLAKCSLEELEAKGVLEAAVKGNHLDVVHGLLERGLDPDEPNQVGHPSEQTWSAGGPLFQAVLLNRIEIARVLLQRGANPNANVFTSGSPAYRAYEAGNPEMMTLIEQHGGWVDPGAAGYARKTEIAREMLSGQIDPHIEPNDFSGRTVAEQLLWGGASSRCEEIVSMALEHVDWPPDDPRWFWMLWRPLPGHWDLDEQQQAESCACFRLILARCGPHHRSQEFGQTILHEVIARDHGVGVQLATMLLDAGARLDIRDTLLSSTPLGWACRWGRVELAKLLLARGADPIEADAEPWATPSAWAEKMHWPEIRVLLEKARATR